MSQPLPRGDFEKIDTIQFTTQETIDVLLMIHDYNES